jgi:anti-anti-sigma factor
MLKLRTQKVGNIAILCLQGQVVIGNTDELGAAVRSQPHASMVVLDFAQVDLIDAKGLGVLLELREFAKSRGIEFRLVNMYGLVEQVLNITRLDSVFAGSEELLAGARADERSALILHTPCFQGA